LKLPLIVKFGLKPNQGVPKCVLRIKAHVKTIAQAAPEGASAPGSASLFIWGLKIINVYFKKHISAGSRYSAPEWVYVQRRKSRTGFKSKIQPPDIFLQIDPPGALNDCAGLDGKTSGDYQKISYILTREGYGHLKSVFWLQN
jgi:hypothetical protein